MLYNVFLVFFLLFAFLMLFIITSAFVGFLLTRVPFVPTHASDIEFIIKRLGVSRADVFYDLGSGNGKVVFLVEKLSGAKAKGFERTLWTHLWAMLNKIFIRSKAEFVNKDFFKENWSEANYIYGYLYPPLMGRVKEKFLQDCKPGAVAIIRDFPLPDFEPTEVIKRPKNHEIYLYKL